MALPIQPFREKIVSELSRAGALVLTAPTGSGKSTQVPQFLLGAVEGRIVVLEPRRISAKSLAARVARELGSSVGAKVGYQVRFEAKGQDAPVVFQTYGVLLQRIVNDPALTGVGAVVLDEFHERTLEADLVLGWLKTLRARRPELKVVVMSATLDAAEAARFLPGAAALEVPGRTFPVEIRHRPQPAGAEPAQGVLEALRELDREGLDGSVLVFMPGLREIRRTLTVIGPFCRERGLPALALHGSMELEEQQRALDPDEGPCVVVATNVAETGLTIPDVKAVIDSGLHRVAAFDAARGINTLYLSRISRGNADQRAGRAGRTAPGRCLRLWSKSDEAGMAPTLKPEVLRLELGAIRLKAASLPGTVEWITPPPPGAWDAAGEILTRLGALDGKGALTPRGRALLRFPVSPRLAAVLADAQALGGATYSRACAMAAVFESAGDRKPGGEADLSFLASEELAWDAAEIKKQLERLGEPVPSKTGSLAALWLSAFSDRLAARSGEGLFYTLADGRSAQLPNVKNPPELILALDARERAGGGQARQVAVGLYLPFSAAEIEAAFPGECAWTRVSEFDERKKRVVKEERLVFRGLVLARREITEKADKKASAALWAEKYASGELRHPAFDEKAEQLVTRVKLARRLYPDMGFPEMGADDWRLIYGELCGARNTLFEIERQPLIPHVESYLGAALTSFLDRMLPTSKKLPSGRIGKFAYFESRPPELSARLGDFVKMTGRLALCDGKLPVLFDILAPNYRTVQKTDDLSSFWANTYPEVKKELKRRYPKHPWP